MKLLQRLESGIVLADGAMGTLLYSHGLHSSFEELNLTDGGLITDIHRAYIEAGADVIQTNTYGANEGKLRLHGLEDDVIAINKAAVGHAKRAANNQTIILGTIGGMKHIGSVHVTNMEREYMLLQQSTALLEEGVDGLLLETFYDEEELYEAVKVLRNHTKLPIIAQLALHEVGVMQSGRPVEEAMQHLLSLGADVIGLNCHLGPLHMIESLRTVPLPNDAFLSAFPNAGLPKYTDGRYMYEGTDAYFEQMATLFVEQGVRLLGGCCGTTPAHIKAMKRALMNVQPITKKEVIPRTTKIEVKPAMPRKTQSLAEKAKRETTIVVELDPPKTLDTRRFFEGAKALTRAGADAITLADNSLASPRICNTALASMLLNSGVNVMAHLTCRDRNIIGLQSHLLGLETLRIHEVLALTGDPARVGDFPGATSVYDLSSFELIRFMKEMNEGRSYVGKTIGQKTNFSVGAAFNPNVRKLEAAVRRLEKKVDAGADYFLTQPVYDIEMIRNIYEATKHIEQPIFLGIMPLISKRNADFLHFEVPGITVPDAVREAMGAAESPEAAVQEGLRFAKELLDEALTYFKGIYLVTPFLRYEITEELVTYAINHPKRKIEIHV
jgi:methionine synthase / methylenetetrahydrofolate reductase(NADPH)